MMTTMDRDTLITAQRHIDRAPKDQLVGLVSALLERDDVPESLLAFVLRGVRPPVPAGRSSMGAVTSTAALAELAQGMVYKEREGRRRWMRIVEIGPVVSMDMAGAAQYRNASVQPAFSHDFVKEAPTMIYDYETPFEVRVPEGSALA